MTKVLIWAFCSIFLVFGAKAATIQANDRQQTNRLEVWRHVEQGRLGGYTLIRDDGQWGDKSPQIREWYQKLMQPFPNQYVSCCGEADAFEADLYEVEGDHYVAIITDGKGKIPNGTRISVPNNKMKWDAGNPTGHGVIFIGSAGQIYCYVTPASG